MQWWSLLSIGLAFACTAYAPLLLLTLGPLLFGVPHLLADVRYLVLRQRLHQRRVLVGLVVPLLLAQCLAPSASLACVAVAVTALCAHAGCMARLSFATAAFALALVCRRHEALALMIMAHAHNGVALVLWSAWARKGRAHVLPALLVFAIGSVLILHGELEVWLLRSAGLVPFALALDVDTLALGLSPSAAPLWTLRSLLFFCFAQSVHYAVWTRFIPEEDRVRAGVRSWRASYADLKSDFGLELLLLFGVAWVWFLVLGLFDCQASRGQYLRLALFHGPLELCVGVLFLLERRSPSRAKASPCPAT